MYDFTNIGMYCVQILAQYNKLLIGSFKEYDRIWAKSFVLHDRENACWLLLSQRIIGAKNITWICIIVMV